MSVKNSAMTSRVGTIFWVRREGDMPRHEKTGLRAKNQEHISEKDIYKQREVA